MKYTLIRDYLEKAEKGLLALIGTADSSKDYDEMQRCLDLAREINTVRSKIPSDNDSKKDALSPNALESAGPSEFKTSPLPMQNSRKQPETMGSASDTSDLPCYFVYQSKLFKVGQSRGDTDELYKKSMPLEDALTIFTSTERLLELRKTVSLADIMQELSHAMPNYKVNLTLGVLTQMGILVTQGRGKYAYADEAKGPADNWIRMLQEYPQRCDLLDAIAAQRKG